MVEHSGWICWKRGRVKVFSRLSMRKRILLLPSWATMKWMSLARCSQAWRMILMTSAWLCVTRSPSPTMVSPPWTIPAL
ncbi:hypothetical protein D3C85_1084970 [compost metagenome]